MIMVHGRFTYACEKCGRHWDMYLEDGVERSPYNDCAWVSKSGRAVQPSPFMIRCYCGDYAHHVGQSVFFPVPIPLMDIKAGFFQYDASGRDGACGIPQLAKKGSKY